LTTVILAEDGREIRDVLSELLRNDGHQVIEARDGGELTTALAFAYLDGSESNEDFLVLTDLHLPGSDGLSAIRGMRAQGHHPSFVLMTARPDVLVRVEAAHLGALAVLAKPFDFEDLRSVIRGARGGNQ
jgi:DNA-binding response OmpR family regulator